MNDEYTEVDVVDFDWDLGDIEEEDREFPVLLCTDYM